MNLIPQTLQTNQAKLQSNAAEVLNCSPFSDEILNRTTVQLVWIIKNHYSDKSESNENYSDDDYEIKQREALNNG